MPQQNFYQKNETNNRHGKPVFVKDKGGDRHNDFAADFKEEWIVKGVDQDAVSFADRLGKFLYENKLSTSQIRNVFGEIKRIEIKGFEKEKSSFYLLKPKMAYAASRVEKYKAKGINALKTIFDLSHSKVENEATYKNFVDFFESILAYHKAYGGRDNG
ncbi:type III-A CRISPR-associated protein Csm2 [Anaerophaga thermohalophila]|uniref:type III-A CRISPR-associated protein Csm2 n=1 Tax=Anaerophaga thermohalophila TaxID=177400 RepID=UPI000237BCD2|nr:type III-A CRISPR-associated protein Csm2 [Anaerophaga thermohalophila]